MFHSLCSKVTFMGTALLLSGLTPAAAQTVAGSAPLKLDALTVTGTRRLDRTVVESMVPVDIVSAAALQTSVSAELTDKLVQAVPSFNVQRLTIGEGAAFVRPARLRGLSPDQTLVLINGKRQHRSALITGGFSQGADLGQIPAFGLQRVEVLRGPSTLLFGSGAIGGVVNVIDSRIPRAVPDAPSGAFEHRHECGFGRSEIVPVRVGIHIGGQDHRDHGFMPFAFASSPACGRGLRRG